MTQRLTAYFDDSDYAAIRTASMQGRLDVWFTRAASGEVTFRVKNLKKFCKQLNSIIDFGATTAAEVFGVDHLV